MNAAIVGFMHSFGAPATEKFTKTLIILASGLKSNKVAQPVTSLEQILHRWIRLSLLYNLSRKNTLFGLNFREHDLLWRRLHVDIQ